MSTTTEPPTYTLPPLPTMADADLLHDVPDAPVLLIDCDPSLIPDGWFTDYLVLPLPDDPGLLDLTPLHGRDILIWPRNTTVSKANGRYIREHVKPKPRTLRVGKVDDTSLDPLTAIDGWSLNRLQEFLAQNGVRGPATDDEPPPHTAMPQDYEAAHEATEVPEGAPYQVLGLDHGTAFYIPAGSRQVTEVLTNHHTKGSLLQLAPLQYWELTYPGAKGANWDMAANALLRQSERVGIFDPSRVRGRGAWHDDGRVVLHLGDRLIVDGTARDLQDFQTDYIYEAAPVLRFGRGQALRAADAVKLHDLCKSLNWERPESGTLLAGWLVIAPICGALNWRPHLYLTGESGSGKSWVFQCIVSPVLGDAALALAGKTTEPSIRRGLGSDARPVLLDEFESRDNRISNDTQSVLDLCRYMSSETSATIGKGNASGGVDYFRPRACVMVYSTGVALKEQADKNRFAICTLLPDKSDDKAEKFDTLQKMQATTLTADYIAGLQARTLSLIPVIRPNTAVFARCASKMLGTQRMGDQIGALLAGAYSLHSSGLVTDEAAMAFLAAQSWDEEKAVLDDKDGASCIAHITEYQLPAETAHGPKHRAVGELVRIATGQSFQDELVSRDTACDTLRRHGVLVKQHEGAWWMLIGNRHSGVSRMLRDTAWGTNWSRRIKTADGAIVWPVPVKFTPGPSSERCTAVRIED